VKRNFYRFATSVNKTYQTGTRIATHIGNVASVGSAAGITGALLGMNDKENEEKKNPKSNHGDFKHIKSKQLNPSMTKKQINFDNTSPLLASLLLNNYPNNKKMLRTSSSPGSIKHF
jgi:hypothetical protein